MARARFHIGFGRLLVGLAFFFLQCQFSQEKELHVAESAEDTQSAERFIVLTPEQRESLLLETAVPTRKRIEQKRTVFGTILPNEQHYAHVVTQLSGWVRQVHKQRGDEVSKEEPLALLESPELADAVAAYIAALHHFEVGQQRLARDERLYKQQLIAENAWTESVNLAKKERLEALFAEQKLCGLGLSASQVAQLPSTDSSMWHQVALVSPFDGEVLERDLVVGEWVSAQHPAFTVANLDTVWAELELPLTAMPSMRLHQSMLVRDALSKERAPARVIYISPSLNRENMTVQVLSELDNSSKKWRLGSWVEAELPAGEKEALLTLPRTALQRIEGQDIVFVEGDGGFIVRCVEVGTCDERCIEILSGLSETDRCAINRTFDLKSQLLLKEEEDRPLMKGMSDD